MVKASCETTRTSAVAAACTVGALLLGGCASGNGKPDKFLAPEHKACKQHTIEIGRLLLDQKQWRALETDPLTDDERATLTDHGQDQPSAIYLNRAAPFTENGTPTINEIWAIRKNIKASMGIPNMMVPVGGDPTHVPDGQLLVVSYKPCMTSDMV